jgi:hypothetical protein
MLNKLQQRCWPDNAPFTIDEINFIGYFAHSPSETKRLEGMITIEYRHHTPLEQDLQVGLLLAMHIGNDIPTGEAGSGLKWCPIRNELAHTSCTVTRVSARRSTRGHCRQDIPLGIYDRKQQRWTLRDKTEEIAYLLKLAGKSDDSSMIILNKIRSAPWNSKPPNLRIVKEKCEHRATQWQQIPQSPPTSPQPSPREESGSSQSTTQDWHSLIWSALSGNRNVSMISAKNLDTDEPAHGPHEPVLQNDLPTKRVRSAALELLHVLSSDPRGQADTHTFFKKLEEQGHATLAREGRTVLRRVINSTDENASGDFQEWIHQLTEQADDHAPKSRATVSTHNLGPIGISLSMDVVEDTLAMGTYVSCMQDVLLHGQNLRSVKRSIADLNPNYQIYSDIARHDTDDIRGKNYAGWGSSGMACLTMLHKDIFNISLCRKHEWRTGKDRRTTLGRGRVLWIKAVTVTGQKVDIVNVYQHTSKYPQKQQRLQEALAKALDPIPNPCMFFGDFNASTYGGRVNYAPTHANNPTTIADQAFAEFIEATKGTVIQPVRSTWKNPFGGLKSQEAKLDFGIVYNLQEEFAVAEVDWISPLHDHARVSFTIGDTVWGNIKPPTPALSPQRTSQSDELKLEQMLQVRSVVDETCTPLALKFLDPQNQLSSSDSVHRLLETRRSLFATLAPKRHQGMSKGKLMAHRNAEQREAITHIVSLQKALDKPLHLGNLSLAAEESFHIMDLRTELLLSREEMLAAVKKGPWKRAVESLLVSKKQFLEDTTNKQILSSRWQLEERERKAFKKEWASFSKEESSHMTLGEINQKTVVGLLVQELIPALDTALPWEPGAWNKSDTHATMTHSTTRVVTLRMAINPPTPASDTESSVGQIGSRGIITKDGFMWISEKPDASALLEAWASDIGRLSSTEVPFTIAEGFKRSIEIRTPYLPDVRDLLHSSSFWSTSHVLARSLLYDEGPWKDTNRDSVIEQVYETSGLPPQACCPNLMCSNVKPVVVSGTRPTQAQPSEEPPSFTSERYLDCFCPSCWHFQDFRHNKDTVRDWSFMRNPLASGKKIEEPFFSKGLKGPLTDTEMQKSGRLLSQD